MKTKTIKLGEQEFKLKELSWDDQLVLSEADKFSTRLFMKLCIEEPTNLEEVFKKLTKHQGNKLLEEVNEINRLDEDISDFQQPNQKETEKKDTKQNTG
jgi:hypothetical protein|tara:strand:+ start:568 stop:864 length:297 start_codon:yes stop_codon:yes gene_type:complete